MAIDNTEYSRFIYVLGRSLRFNPAKGAELAAVQAFFEYEKTNRVFLKDVFVHNGVIANDARILGKNIEDIGRSFINLPVNSIGKDEADKIHDLIIATGKRCYGQGGNAVATNLNSTLTVEEEIEAMQPSSSSAMPSSSSMSSESSESSEEGE